MKPRGMHSEALVEFRQAAGFYENCQPGLGEQFKNSVVTAAEKLQSGVSGRSPWISDTRLARVRRFPYDLVYREYSDRIYIIAVYHFSRREDYWVHRLDDLPDEETSE